MILGGLHPMKWKISYLLYTLFLKGRSTLKKEIHFFERDSEFMTNEKNGGQNLFPFPRYDAEKIAFWPQ